MRRHPLTQNSVLYLKFSRRHPMASLFIPLTGLESSSEALSVTSNNLANLNTIGFKTQRALFGDLFYQQVGTSGDGDPTQIGLGATVESVDSQFTEGSIQAS